MSAVAVMSRVLPQEIIEALSRPDDEDRFALCALYITEIWAVGLSSCDTEAEREQWRTRVIKYLRMSQTVWESAEL
jgi:hypothetical protein